MGKLISGINDLATINPELAKDWHPTKNGNLTPSAVAANSNKKAWWKCSKGHEWQAIIASRNKGSGCPYCANTMKIKIRISKTGSFADIHPELVSEWHPTKNGELTPEQVTHGSEKKVWWQCEKGHEYEAIISNRSKGRGCPVCANREVLQGDNDLATTNPELAKEWHPTQNGDLTPEQVTKGSCKKVWWLGNCGHEWQARIHSRNHGHGCPVCARDKRK